MSETANAMAAIIEENGNRFVICPKCGQMVRTYEQSFGSKEEADCEALGKCTCDDAREWRRFRVKNVIRFGEQGEMVTAACRFCGQMQTIDERWLGELPAIEAVTRICRCINAKTYQDMLEAERRREEDLSRAKLHIETLFSDVAESRRANVTGLLNSCCEMVYDRQIMKVSVTLDGGCSATVGQASKGALKIVRSDKTSEGVEI